MSADPDHPPTRAGVPAAAPGTRVPARSAPWGAYAWLDLLADGVTILDAAGRYAFLNGAALRRAGRPADELLGRSIWDVYPTMRDTPFGEVVARALAHGVADSVEAVQAPSGRWYDVMALPDGASGGVLLQWHEVTARVRRERWAAAQAGLLRLVAADRALPTVLDALCRALEEACPGGHAAVLLVDAAGATLRAAAAPSLPADVAAAADGLPVGAGGGPCGAAAAAGEPVLAADLAAEPSAEGAPAARLGLRACWSHPVLGARNGAAGRALGVVAVYHREARAPAHWELACLAEGAHVASVAVTRARADAALRRHEQEMAALVENSPDYVARVDRALRYLYVNPSAARDAGRTPGDFVGRRLGDVAAPAPLADRWRDAVRRALESGEPGELTAALPLGAETRWVHTRVTPEFGPEGEVASALLVARDVTELRRALDAHAASEERYRLALGATGAAVADWDVASGRLAWAGAAAELLGYPPEAAGSTIDWFRDRLHPDDRPAVEAAYRALAQDRRETWAVRCRFRHAGGHWVDLEAHGLVVRDAGGQAVRCVGALRGAQGPAGAAAAGAPARGPARPWALLAEDEPGVRATVRRMLERAGYAVAEAPDGDAALAQLAAAPAGAAAWALLVSDVLMPGLDGVALAGRARALHPELPVVLLSGYCADLVPGAAALPAGVEFLEKPAPSAELRAAIARATAAAAAPGAP